MIDLINRTLIFFIGFIVGVVLVHNYGVRSDTVRVAIEQCEVELPRDQHCVITAVVEGDGDG